MDILPLRGLGANQQVRGAGGGQQSARVVEAELQGIYFRAARPRAAEQPDAQLLPQLAAGDGGTRIMDANLCKPCTCLLQELTLLLNVCLCSVRCCFWCRR